MSKEIEIKLRLSDPDRIEDMLETRQISKDHTENQINIYFDRDAELKHKKECLRIRHTFIECEEFVLLAHKSHISGSKITTREETEIELSKSPQLVLEKLGYKVILQYEKIRHVYLFNHCIIAIDYIDGLGCFLEIEGLIESDVSKTVKSLSLQDEEVIEKSYLEMLLSID